MTPGQRQATGVTLLVVGWVSTVIAAWLIWSSVQRWYGVSEVCLAMQRLREGKLVEARQLAAVAAERMPSEPTPLLLATDLARDGAADQLLQLSIGLSDQRHRRTMLAAVALSRIMQGKPADVDLDGTGDGRLLAALAAARAGKSPGKMAGEAEEPPHHAVQCAALVASMHNAWTRGEAEAVQRFGGALLLVLPPQHPEAGLIAVAVLATDSATSDEIVLARLGELPVDRQAALVRALATLVPGRRPALARRFPKMVEAAP